MKPPSLSFRPSALNGLLRQWAASNLAIGGLLLLVAAFNIGCPVGDPHTESRITNDTESAVEIDLVLDKNQWSAGFEPGEYEKWLAGRTEDWIRGELEEYVVPGTDVEFLEMDAGRFAGKFRIAPSKFMIVNASMGRGPYISLSKLQITKDQEIVTFEGEEEVVKQFKPVENERGLFELKVSDSF